MKTIAALLFVAVLAGCTTVQDLKTSGYRDSFVVQQNYQATYRTLSDELRRCLQGAMSGAVVTGEVFTDIKRAEIRPMMSGPYATYPMAIIEITEIDAGSAKVEYIGKKEKSGTPEKLAAIFSGKPFCPQ